MPRTKSTRQIEEKPAPEQLQKLSNSKLDLLIFFEYYDGLNTNGQIGFDPALNPGSVYHKRKIKLLDGLNDGVFRSKAKKLAILAKKFKQLSLVPTDELRPRFDGEVSIADFIHVAPQKSLPERLGDAITDVKDIFIFFNYYDGFVSNGQNGFNPSAGPPGSVIHKRSATSVLGSMKNDQFRKKGKVLGGLAKEFKEKGESPPIQRPSIEVGGVPIGLRQQALILGHSI